MAHDQLATLYLERGLLTEAAAEFQRSQTALGHAYVDALRGRKEAARRQLRELDLLARSRYVSPLGPAALHMALGETELTLDWLEKAYQERAPALSHVRADWQFRQLHPDPRFQDLLRRIGLPPVSPTGANPP